MISHLSVKNFAIIKDLEVDFSNGLNIITGETGSGKSIIIEAVNMALGGRADSSFVRTGCAKSTIQLVIENEYGEQIILTREIQSGGRSTGRIDGELVPLSKLSSFCKNYVDLHGQYDNQALLDPENHIHILDSYDINDLNKCKNKYVSEFEEYSRLNSELSAVKKSISESSRKRDFMEYELKEIEKADIYIGEDEELKEKLILLQNSEKIFSSASAAYSNLYSDEKSCTGLLMDSINELKKISGLSPQFSEIQEMLEECYYKIDESSSALSEFTENMEFSVDVIDSIISRQEQLENLKRKYGGSLEAVTEHLNILKEALSNIENSDLILKDLENKLSDKSIIVSDLANELSKLRKEAALDMEAAVNKELSELNFKNSLFKIDFRETDIGPEGSDEVEFLISTNKGEALKPLAKIASGGEISRIMLAFKRIIGDYSSVPTFIFDEIDTGISGSAAEVVGAKLSQIAGNHQILCITHLPQIAVMGDSHYIIEKYSDESQTYTTVSEMDDDALVREIARLSGSSTLTENARNNAEEMIANARKFKK
ncbi:MAG: DNA repair protein RecN [Clostridiales bacterium]|nr:DNA repair protein RecN [Clostridiales bacterium]